MDPIVAEITGPFSHDLMVQVLTELYPDLAHGKDYVVGHDFNSAEDPTDHGDPYIIYWKVAIPQPSNEEVKAKFLAEEVKYRTAFARRYRDACLDGTDGKDNIPGVKGEKWKVYRQALRDLPTVPGFPLNFKWPDYPG